MNVMTGNVMIRTTLVLDFLYLKVTVWKQRDFRIFLCQTGKTRYLDRYIAASLPLPTAFECVTHSFSHTPAGA